MTDALSIEHCMMSPTTNTRWYYVTPCNNNIKIHWDNLWTMLWCQCKTYIPL